MTGCYVLSPLAQSDLDDIWNHTESRWGIDQAGNVYPPTPGCVAERPETGIDQAEMYIRQLWQHIEAIAVQPTRGRRCPEVRAGYRKYRSRSHFLFYRVTGGRVDVVRILRQRMDFESHLPGS